MTEEVAGYLFISPFLAFGCSVEDRHVSHRIIQLPIGVGRKEIAIASNLFLKPVPAGMGCHVNFQKDPSRGNSITQINQKVKYSIRLNGRRGLDEFFLCVRQLIQRHWNRGSFEFPVRHFAFDHAGVAAGTPGGEVAKDFTNAQA